MTPRCEADHVRAKFSATREKANREARPGARRNCLAVDLGAAWACQARYDSAGTHDGGLWPLYLPKTQNSCRSPADRSTIAVMGDLLKLIWCAVAWLFSRAALQTEVLALRHQLNVLKRRTPKRVAVNNIDRLVGLYHLAPEVLDAVKTLKPETIIRWHCAGFRAWWRWKSTPRGGRPRTPDEIPLTHS
jgi:hypothetical protein